MVEDSMMKLTQPDAHSAVRARTSFSIDDLMGRRSPHHHSNHSSLHHANRSPIYHSNRSPVHHGNRSPLRQGNRSPMQNGNRSPPYHGNGSPLRHSNQSPLHNGNRSPLHRSNRSPHQHGKHLRARSRSRSPCRSPPQSYHMDHSPRGVRTPPTPTHHRRTPPTPHSASPASDARPEVTSPRLPPLPHQVPINFMDINANAKLDLLKRRLAGLPTSGAETQLPGFQALTSPHRLPGLRGRGDLLSRPPHGIAPEHLAMLQHHGASIPHPHALHSLHANQSSHPLLPLHAHPAAAATAALLAASQPHPGLPGHPLGAPPHPLGPHNAKELLHLYHLQMQGAPPFLAHHRFPELLLPPFRKPKRIRTAFSPTQLLQLEKAFDKNHYVVGQERKELASNLGLTETQVKVWFQNRRTKFKRVKTEDGDGQGQGDDDGLNYMHEDDIDVTDSEEDIVC